MRGERVSQHKAAASGDVPPRTVERLACYALFVADARPF